MAIAYFCDHCGAEIAPEDTICPVCQQPLASSATFQASGTLLNERYALISEVGAGGFGAVYKARDTQEHDRLVAVKQINLQGLSSQEIIEATDAFNREAEILTTLSHPLLPTIFDRFSDPAHWYLVMTYIDGTTLDEYLQQHRVSGSAISAGLPLGETLEIALRLCGALHYLHSQQPPVIFRDLKPGNIMRTRKGQLYLIDFGIARRFKPGQAKDTIPFGSPGFAAPEQYGRAQTTPRADIYSLGALLYCLITGDDPSEHPFDFPSLHYYDITGTRELNALIQRMVSPDPISRPANIQVVRAEFRRIQDINTKANQQGRIWTPPQGQTPPANGSGQQHIFLNPTLAKQQQTRKTTRRAVITTALILGGVAAFGGIAALVNQQPSAGTSVTDQNQEATDYQATADAQSTQSGANATATVTNETPAVPLTGPTFWTPDLRYAAATDLNMQRVELWDVQSQKILQVIKVPAYYYTLAVQWSPDATKVLLFPDSADVQGWDAQSGRQLFTLPLSASDSFYPTTFSWSPNGQYLATGDKNGSSDPSTGAFHGSSILALLRATDGKRLSSTSISISEWGVSETLAWSPDSRYIAFAGVNPLAKTDWSVGIWDVTTFTQISTLDAALPFDLQGGDDVASMAWSPTGKQLAMVISNSIWTCTLAKSNLISQLISPDNASDQVTNLTWSPDETRLAAIQGGTLAVWDIAGNAFKVNSDGPTVGLVAFAWSSDGRSITTVDENNVMRHWSIS